VPQDGLVQVAQFGTRNHPQVLIEGPPQPAERLEGLGLPPVAVQRDHQLAPSPLTQRTAGHQALQPGDDLVVTTTSEWLAKWHTGRTSVGESMKAGVVTFDGPLELARRVAGWGGRGVFDRPVLAEMAAMAAASAAAADPGRAA